jgi:hypothetical protein
VRLLVDTAAIRFFVDSLFRYADDGTFVTLRAFDQLDGTKPPFAIRSVKLNGLGSHQDLVDTAARLAQRCANNATPIVFAPPIASFSNPNRARAIDLANGLALSVEIDDVDPDDARARLEGILGPPTVVVASGSDWSDRTTGEIKPKIHIHWRLNEPTRTLQDHNRLREARDLATSLIGGDPTAKAIVHPLRWPGSWNLKRQPRLASIVKLNANAEIDLGEALDALRDASGQTLVTEFKRALPAKPLGPDQFALFSSAFAAIPNEDAHYDTWIRLGYAAHRAAGGSDQGRDLWDQWSRKSTKFNTAEQDAAWKRICAAVAGASAPRQISAGTIFWMARQAGWERPLPEPPAHLDEPPPHPGPRYFGDPVEALGVTRNTGPTRTQTLRTRSVQ